MRVVVVGGGVSGLAAARALREVPTVERITVLESSPRMGGHLATATVAGLPVDTAADRILGTAPHMGPLLAGVGVRLDAPATTDLSVVLDGELRALPSGLVMGVPTDLTALARSGLLDTRALARVPLDHVLPASTTEPDLGIGRYVAERLGTQVVERITGPVVMATFAGPAVELSLRALLPALYERSRHERSLVAAARELLDSEPGAKPRHVGVVGGIAVLVDAWRAELERAGVHVEVGAPVRRLERTPHGWRLAVGAAGDDGVVEADAVVLAVPARPAARLLDGVALGASVHLAEIVQASVATVSLAYRRSELVAPDGQDPLGASGFVVSRGEPRRLLSATYATSTWPWRARLAQPEDLAVVRVLLGGVEDVEVLQQPDDGLVEHARRELSFLLRTGRAQPVDAVVARWGGALPQYAVGHVDRVAAVRESVASVPGLAVCGATYDGTGIAACVASAYRAVDDLVGRG